MEGEGRWLREGGWKEVEEGEGGSVEEGGWREVGGGEVEEGGWRESDERGWRE